MGVVGEGEDSSATGRPAGRMYIQRECFLENSLWVGRWVVCNAVHGDMYIPSSIYLLGLREEGCPGMGRSWEGCNQGDTLSQPMRQEPGWVGSATPACPAAVVHLPACLQACLLHR